MDSLPEELVDQIVSCVQSSHVPFFTRPDSRTLYSLCLTSKKFYRVTRPHLYVHVHSTSGSMGRRLLETLLANPELAKFVNCFGAQHTTEGCFQPIESSIEQEDLYGTVEDQCASLLVSTLACLPQLEELDLSRFGGRSRQISDWLKPMTEHFDQDDPFSTSFSRIFSQLRHVSIHLWDGCASDLTPFFKLPSLRSLEVDMRHRDRVSPSSVGNPVCESNVEALSFIGMNSHCYHEVWWMLEQCPKLCDVRVAMTAENLPAVMGLFGWRNIARWLSNIHVAIEGMWFYDIEFSTPKPENMGASEVGRWLYNGIVFATNAYRSVGERIEMPDDWPYVQSVAMRELTDEEKRAYDVRSARRP